MHRPDNWVVIRLKGADPHYRVLAGWSGGYLTGDSWRLNSGIVSHKRDGDLWLFRGWTGSVYGCHVDSYMLRKNNAYIWENLKRIHGDKVEMLEDREWDREDWDWILRKGVDGGQIGNIFHKG